MNPPFYAPFQCQSGRFWGRGNPFRVPEFEPRIVLPQADRYTE